MKVPLSWLQDFVDISDITPEVLADKLTNIGFEIEEIIYLGQNIEKVYTGKIKKIEKHPNADKLVVCTLDMGSEVLTIVTGATNVNEGDVVPVATDGAILPCGKNIKNSVLRGVASQGMLCSGEELCIDDTVIEGAEVDGILILPPETRLGLDIKTVLGLDDYVFDISITPNRPDCNSIWGIAREVGAVLGKKVNTPSLKYEADTSIKNDIKVNILNYDLCPRYMAGRVKDVIIAPSPKWMRDRLRKVGIRAINNFADITNYVLIEVGQPMHAFDYMNIQDGTINVRTAKDGESITALDGKTYTLKSDQLVIADAQKPVAIAGIMGGEYSSILPDTTEVVFESAIFARGSVRTTSRSLGLSSDSSARFTKGVDYWSCQTGMQRALALVYELGCGKIVGEIVDVKQNEPKEKVIDVSIQRINNLLGIAISPQTMVEILEKLEIKCQVKGDTLTCVIPLFRTDLENHADIAEEIIRYYGYDKIGLTLPETSPNIKIGSNKFYKAAAITKQTMVGLGLSEILTYSFINKDWLIKLNLKDDDYRLKTIKLLNPLSEEYEAMRTTLIPNLLGVAAYNLNHKNNEFKLFELSRVYLPKELPLTELPQEPNYLGAVICSKDDSFFTVKGIVENILQDFGLKAEYSRSTEPFLHPGISADVIVNNQKVGFLGAVHPSVLKNFDIEKSLLVLELDYDKVWQNNKAITFKPLSKFQAIERDLAFLVKEEIPAQDLIKEIQNCGGTNLESVELFDVYTGSQIQKGYKSMAFSLVFRSHETTLKDQDIVKNIDKIIRTLKYKYNAELRS
ncbi:MAG TPA: phenylalanine--tRNA ligase subunit beta [Clostridia bacterium]